MTEANSHETPAVGSQATPDQNSEANTSNTAPFTPARIARSLVGGGLMGTANLIPGVSGGTMILAMGLYEDFIGAVADITAFRWRKGPIIFLGLVGIAAVAAIGLLSSLIMYLLFAHTSLMFALFIGLTLGGVPTLLGMIGKLRASAIIGCIVGFGLMLGIATLQSGAAMPRNMGMDVVSGVVGSTTMVLPGISGSYMLLVLDQYDRAVGAVHDLTQGQFSALWIIVPLGLGAVIGIVALSNILKVLLNRFEKATLGVLLGMLLGSVLGLWPFDRAPTEKILGNQASAELVAYAHRIGSDVDADETITPLDTPELVEHILIAWDAGHKEPALMAQRHEAEALRAFAVREHLDIQSDDKPEAIAQAIANQWSERPMAPVTTRERIVAVIAAIVGFAVTALLGRLGQSKPKAAKTPSTTTA